MLIFGTGTFIGSSHLYRRAVPATTVSPPQGRSYERPTGKPQPHLRLTVSPDIRTWPTGSKSRIKDLKIRTGSTGSFPRFVLSLYFDYPYLKENSLSYLTSVRPRPTTFLRWAPHVQVPGETCRRVYGGPKGSGKDRSFRCRHASAFEWCSCLRFLSLKILVIKKRWYVCMVKTLEQKCPVGLEEAPVTW